MFLLALAACIPDQGSSAIESEAGPDVGDAAGPVPIDAGTQESSDATGEASPSTQSVTRKIEGLVNDSWVITDENGKPGSDGPGTLDVPANAKVHFILTSDPSGEAHKFQIMIPSDPSANVDMPSAPATATLDWIAPPTPGRYKGGINCSAHKDMATDIVVQP